MVGFKNLLTHPRKVVLLGAILTIAITAITYAYVQYYYTLPRPKGPKTSIISPPIEFTIELEKEEFLQDEVINFTVSLKNISNETIKSNGAIVTRIMT